MPGFLEVGGEVPGELGKPRADRVPGHAQQVDPAGLVSDQERRIRAGQGERAVHVEQADRQDGPGVGAEKCAPLVIVCGWRRDLPTAQDLSEVAFPGLRSGAGAGLSAALATMLRGAHDRSTPAAAWGFTRRSTATSLRRTSISAFFDADDRASSASQNSTATPFVVRRPANV